MLCAHTTRRLKPGGFEDFRRAFEFEGGEQPPGWVRFHMLRGLSDANEVVTFGFFEGTLEELEKSREDRDYAGLRERLDPLVETVASAGA